MQTRQRGTAIVEFALVLPLLLLLTMITTEFGRAIYQYNTIVKSVRQATRYLSLQTPNTKAAEAKNLVVYGKPTLAITDADVPLAIGLSTSQVLAPVWQTVGSNPVINTVTITVSGYKFRPLFASVFGVTFSDSSGDISFGNISATMRCSS